MAKITERLANWVVRNATLDLKSTVGWKDILAGGQTESGVQVTEETALKYSAVNLAVRLRSETRASLPCSIYRTSEGKNDEDKNHPLYPLLAYQPNPWMNYFDFWVMINTYQDLWGNAYALILKKRGEQYPHALVPIHPQKVDVKIVNYKVVYRITGNTGYDGEYKPKDILHFKGVSLDGLKGKGPIQLAAENLGIVLAAEKFGAKYFGKEGVLRATLETDSTINDAAYDTLQKRLKTQKDHDTFLLDRGLKYNPIDVSPESLQFLQTRQFGVQDVARWFNVPVAFLQDHQHSTYNNVEHQDLTFSKYTIRPILRRDEAEMEMKLLGEERMNYDIKWNMNAILRADVKSRAEYYAKMIQHRIMNANEVRALENLDPYDGGDVYENPNTLSTNPQNDGNDD
jgi:HK97 family phage portal protein